MTRVEVPEGCVGIDFPDGSRADARDRAGMVEVTDAQATMIRAVNGDLKIVGARIQIAGRAAAWRECVTCARDFLPPTGGPDDDERQCGRCRGRYATDARVIDLTRELR